MDQTDLTAITSAAILLANTPDAAELFDALQTVIRLSAARKLPVALTGAAEPLNALVTLHMTDRPAYDRTLALIEDRRARAGYPPLVAPPQDSFDKRSYMRNFMDRKRQRMNRAVELENLDRPERDKLRGTARLDFCDAQAAKWKKELDNRLKAARAAAGGAISKTVDGTLREQFWAWVDAQLDEAEAKARHPKK